MLELSALRMALDEHRVIRADPARLDELDAARQRIVNLTPPTVLELIIAALDDPDRH
ncbi:MAG TPA: hypothetical protein VJM49_13630 [Acidimicrobiales bacterium]|nr:hypothetical protein [Acidimicrobiales bacterium]